MNHKKIIIPALGTALVGGTIFGATLVTAQTPNSQNSDLIQKIAQKFNLNQSDVQAVFDQDRQDRKNKIQTDLETRLTQAVTDGKISDAQKTAILAKLEEMKNNSQRKQTMDQKKADFDSWLSQNGLTLQTFQDILSHGGKGFRMRGRWGMGM